MVVLIPIILFTLILYDLLNIRKSKQLNMFVLVTSNIFQLEYMQKQNILKMIHFLYCHTHYNFNIHVTGPNAGILKGNP